MEEQRQEDNYNNMTMDEEMANSEGHSKAEKEILCGRDEKGHSEARQVEFDQVLINNNCHSATVDLSNGGNNSTTDKDIVEDGITTNNKRQSQDGDDVRMIITTAMPVDLGAATTSFHTMTPVTPAVGKTGHENLVSGDTTTTTDATATATANTPVNHPAGIETEEHPDDCVDEADCGTDKTNSKFLVEIAEMVNKDEQQKQVEKLTGAPSSSEAGGVDSTNQTDSNPTNSIAAASEAPEIEEDTRCALVTVTSSLSDETASTSRSSNAPSTTNLLNSKETEGANQKYHPVDLEAAAAASAVVVTKTKGGSSAYGLTTTSSMDDEVDNIQEQLRSVTRKRNLLGSVAVLLLIILLVGVPITIYMTTFHSSSDSSDVSSGSNHHLSSNSDFANNLRELVPGVANYTIETIQNDFNSPQAKAYEWIASDPEWYDKYQATWRKQQRFAMACVFYSFSKRFPLYHDRHECTWRYRRQTVICNTRGQVVGLSWLHMMWTELVLHRDTFLPAEMELLPQLETLDFTGSLFRVKYEEQGEYTHTELETFLPLYNVPNSLRALKVLKLSDCTGLQGSLPTSLGLLTSLTLLDLSQNEITGEIPSQLGQLRALQTLDLSINALTATIPSELGQLDDVSTMRLQSNELSGTIPLQLGELPLLNVFLVEENELDSYIPPGFCSIGPMAELSTDFCWTVDNCCD